jgi:hypothetical protein
MPRKREPATYGGLTASQVVAYNLAQARSIRGWTQEEACDALEPFVGRRWSKATYSAAERSMDGTRVRQFDADEILAFARAFKLPLGWFFMPPAPSDVPALGGRADRALPTLADLVFGDAEARAWLDLRWGTWLEQWGPGPVSDAQQAVAELVSNNKAQLVRAAISDLKQWQTSLRSLANQLEDLQTRTRAASHRDLKIDGTAAPADTKTTTTRPGKTARTR